MTGKSGSSSAFEDLAAGGLAGPEGRAWVLFEAAWPELIAKLEVFLRARRLPAVLQEDCGQSVLTRVWRFRTSYRGSTVAELAAWMYRITLNEAARALEAHRRESSEAQVAEAADGGPAPQANAESREALRALEVCLDLLEAQQREVIELLFAAEPCSERDATALLGVSKSYVNVLRQKALAGLARCLEKKGIG